MDTMDTYGSRTKSDLTKEDQLRQRNMRFERNMLRKGYVIKNVDKDGASLFRAVADQLYGDEDMHQFVRTQCMDYIVSHLVYIW